MIGSTIARYRILEVLGRGGMGVVYRAKDQVLGREVALKVLPPELIHDQNLRKRLLNEARALAALDHPGVATVHEADERDGVTFIAMELVRGRPLNELIDAKELSTRRAVELAQEVAETLDAVHARGLLHRDVKPSNVLVTAQGRARLIDFGLAKGVRGATMDFDMTTPGMVVGTACCLSPEQIRDKPVDARSDVFAFGVLLMEAVSGISPFKRKQFHDTLRAVLFDPAPRMTELPEGAPATAELQRIVDRCLAKEPNNRYAEMKTVATDLKALLQWLPAPGSAATRTASSRLRVVVVDDDPTIRAALQGLLESEPDVEVVGECADGFEAVKAVSEKRPDLMLLDVQMPRLGGFEVLELVDRDVGIIFVTAHDDFAIKAMETHAIDYLVKPVEPPRLRRALDNARQRLLRHDPVLFRELAPAVERGGFLDRVLARHGSRAVVVPVDRLDYVAAQGGRVRLRCGSEEYLKDQTLDELAARLDPTQFIRIHADYLIHAARLTHLDPGKDGTTVAVLDDGERLPVDPDGYERLQKRF